LFNKKILYIVNKTTIGIKSMKKKITLVLLFAFTCLSFAQKVNTGKEIMICAHPLAAQAGLEVYNNGGNVVDVAIATAYALGVVEPFGSGIGGEGMMLIYDAKEKKCTVIDFKAISPKAATYSTLDFNNLSAWSRTIKGASVPSAVAGLEYALEKFGKIDRKKVIQPAINYAINGFEADSSLELFVNIYKRYLDNDDYSKKIYCPKGKPVKKGNIVKNKDYGNTLIQIRDKGATDFYSGQIADKIVQDSKKNGGFITKEDLEAYKPLVREALVGNYKGYDILTTPPPCGGMILLEAINILKYFNLAECKKENDYSLHILSEVFKKIYIDESAFNSDPEFYNVPVETVTSQKFAFDRFKEINLASPTDTKDVTIGVIGDKNTTQLTVMDIEGNTVSLTITLSSLFGSAHTVEGCGFHLNNEMQNYNKDKTHPKSLEPHKRVVTSLVPTIITKNGRPIYATGTPGGDLIISTVLQIIINLLEFDMNLEEAMFAPRIFSTYYQSELELENDFPKASTEQLEHIGHELKFYPKHRAYFGAVQSVMYDEKTKSLIGVSDPRRGGAAMGK
jgi:gamma-glutamyltranspeptidase/glutathione hydrolase